MRTYLRGKITLLFMTCAVLIAVPAVAWAAGDQFQDTLVGAATTQTITAGGSFTNTYYVDAGGPDGCDVSSTNPGVFSINVPSGVTKNPTANLSFTACGVANAQTVTFSSNTPSSASGYSISASRVSGPVNSAGQAGFTLVVNAAPPPDTTPPVLNLPDDITAEATGSDGATVTYSADATDNVDGTIAANCLPVSGGTFPLGPTTVNCSATDAAGNESTGSFTVTVTDTTAPAIADHDNVTAEATGPNGANVSYTSPGTTDAVDGPGTANCTPTSGSLFAVGPTTVTCTATDAAGNSSSSTFKVNVSFGWSNFLQPINIPSPTVQQSIFKMGSTVPVKFQLTGASSGITNGTFYLKYAYTGTGDNNGEMESVATTTGTTGTQFRYDATAGQYIYNWSTKGVVTKPGNYELRVYTDSAGTNLLGKVSIELKK